MLEIFTDAEALSRGAAALFVHLAERAVATRGRFVVALSGGGTPRRSYELLAEPAFAARVAWPLVHVFWGDERCVPLDDPLSNARLAREAWLDQVPIPAAQVHPIGCQANPADAARQYEDELRHFFRGGPPRFDLVFLGLGENGHTASLFPGSAALAEQERWAVEVYVPDQDLYRVTLTLPVINGAAVVAFLVAGAAKAQVLSQVLDGPRDPQRLPAQLVNPRSGERRWLVDREAAALLSDVDLGGGQPR